MYHLAQLFRYLDDKGIVHNFDRDYEVYFSFRRFEADTKALETNEEQKEENHGSGQSNQEITIVDSGVTAIPAKSNSMITAGTTIIDNGGYIIVKGDYFNKNLNLGSLLLEADNGDWQVFTDRLSKI